jgi:acetylornithine deacetylase/succinyl-diaminopimelate desuccinylase-like protein
MADGRSRFYPPSPISHPRVTPSDWLSANVAAATNELFDFLRIPSISARSEHKEDVARAADWLAQQLRVAGLQTEIFPTDGHPIVLGEWRGAGESAPTYLVYGHYDVQPVEPLDLWTSPPFEPTVRDGRIYARGSVDDKGQLYLHVKALQAHLATNGKLPVNVILLAEGEEEVRSANLPEFIEKNAERLRCDGVIISDSAMFAPGLPSILFSLRGMSYLQIDIEGPTSDLHSGSYGGAVVNPATALAHILASFHDDALRVTVKGFYDNVVEWDDDIRARIRGLPFREETFRTETGAPALGGEDGYSTLERIWTRPTLEVNGLLSGYTGEGAKTVLPSKAMAKISCRLVPDQTPDEIAKLVTDHVRRVAPPEVKVTITALHSGMPWKATLEGPLFEAGRRALMRAYGTEPVLTGEGGSIPVVGDFQRILDAPVLLMGFGLPGENAHAPDEWMAVENFEKGMVTAAYLWEELGQ